MVRNDYAPVVPTALDMHLYLPMTGQCFVLPLAAQHWLCSHRVFPGTDSPESCRDHRCLRLLGLSLTPKVLSLLKYICYSSNSQLLCNFYYLYCHFCYFTGIFQWRKIHWDFHLTKVSGDRPRLNMYLQLRSLSSINCSIRPQTLIVLVLYLLSDHMGHTCQKPHLPKWLCTMRYLIGNNFTVIQNSYCHCAKTNFSHLIIKTIQFKSDWMGLEQMD